MTVSQNGYSANDRTLIASYTVPGTNLRIALRKGDVSVVLLEYLRRYNAEVEPLSHDPLDLWGYAERMVRGEAEVVSNHASGTAADCRATRHPLGVVGTFTAQQAAALDRLLTWFEGVIRHGKNYTGRKDEMHAEINDGISAVTRIANKIRAAQAPAAPAAPRPHLEDDDAMYIKCDKLKVRGIYSGGILTGLGSPGEAAAMDAQVARGAIVQDVEDFTWNALDARSKMLTGETPAAAK